MQLAKMLMQATTGYRKGRKAPVTPKRAEPMDAEILEDVAYYRKTLSHASEYAVDECTWNDLEMDRVYMSLRFTCTTPGDEVLYAMLGDTGEDDAVLRQRNQGIQAMGDHPEEMQRTRNALTRLGRNPFHSACSYLANPQCKRPGHVPAFVVLVLLPFAFLALGFVHPIFFFGVGGMFAVNMVVYYRCGKTWMKEIAAIRHLAAVVRSIPRIAKALPPALSETRDELHALYAEMKPVARWNALFAMQRQSNFDFFTDYVRIMFQLDMLCLNRLVLFFARHNKDLQRVYRMVGEVDAWQSMAAYRASKTATCQPVFTEETQVLAKGLVHPMMEEAIPNDFEWTMPTLITGSNASGKSTFIKALAVNAILAQSVMTCAAKEFLLPRAKVMTSIALRDNLLKGESYFIVEVKSLKRIVDAFGGKARLLCFVDEILRGTNTAERIAASTSLLSYLVHPNCLCMAATHDIELTRLLGEYKQIHFTETLTEAGMTFSYRVLEGPSNSKNAIALLELMGFPEEVTQRANQLIGTV